MDSYYRSGTSQVSERTNPCPWAFPSRDNSASLALTAPLRTLQQLAPSPPFHDGGLSAAQFAAWLTCPSAIPTALKRDAFLKRFPSQLPPELGKRQWPNAPLSLPAAGATQSRLSRTLSSSTSNPRAPRLPPSAANQHSLRSLCPPSLRPPMRGPTQLFIQWLGQRHAPGARTCDNKPCQASRGQEGGGGQRGGAGSSVCVRVRVRARFTPELRVCVVLSPSSQPVPPSLRPPHRVEKARALPGWRPLAVKLGSVEGARCRTQQEEAEGWGGGLTACEKEREEEGGQQPAELRPSLIRGTLSGPFWQKGFGEAGCAHASATSLPRLQRKGRRRRRREKGSSRAAH